MSSKLQKRQLEHPPGHMVWLRCPDVWGQKVTVSVQGCTKSGAYEITMQWKNGRSFVGSLLMSSIVEEKLDNQIKYETYKGLTENFLIGPSISKHQLWFHSKYIFTSRTDWFKFNISKLIFWRKYPTMLKYRF